ncbi:hypothetical protein HYFRA_00000747 [Hymenoscyphus fraxineus]|uniref:Uncharacterized protein n=1 Tax=Hymenoscyphus fraxineus TaxID=746836 RepID=A0A9N9PM69_9HELO|nr:hypothetical protein HYFRA_00000747 [Hymenoscyphus fraxineus]
MGYKLPSSFHSVLHSYSHIICFLIPFHSTPVFFLPSHQSFLIQHKSLIHQFFKLQLPSLKMSAFSIPPVVIPAIPTSIAIPGFPTGILSSVASSFVSSVSTAVNGQLASTTLITSATSLPAAPTSVIPTSGAAAPTSNGATAANGTTVVVPGTPSNGTAPAPGAPTTAPKPSSPTAPAPAASTTKANGASAGKSISVGATAVLGLVLLGLVL